METGFAATVDVRAGETVLDALLRARHPVRVGCRSGICHSCLIATDEPDVPDAAREALPNRVIDQGGFLPCSWQPGERRVRVFALREPAAEWGIGVIADIASYTEHVYRLRVATSQRWRAGQFAMLAPPDRDEARAFSIASGSDAPWMEFHIRKRPGGRFSGWLATRRSGDAIRLLPPRGCCVYDPGSPRAPLLLAGAGTGAAPLLGIVRDALRAGHRGPIEVYLGGRTGASIYNRAEWDALAASCAELSVHYVLSEPGQPSDRRGHAAELFVDDLGSLEDWRVFVCGSERFVQQARQAAFLAGAALSHIQYDPFLATG